MTMKTCFVFMIAMELAKISPAQQSAVNLLEKAITELRLVV
ncbi:MAG: hypothetical protein HW419_2013 [Deltaproteobacteria bacterium]|nr:hypothetical protein [Deltaproteobacteria bacterium]